MSTRVVRISHSSVVAEYRRRDHDLRHRHGYDMHLVCPPSYMEGGSRVEVGSDSLLPIHVVGIRGHKDHPILFWYAHRALRRVLREVQPQIVDLHEEPYSLAAVGALSAVRAEVPDAAVCIYSAQNILKHYPPPFRQLERRALGIAAAAYPCSTEAGQVLRAKGFRGSLHVLPLGVDLAPEHAPPGDSLTVGFLGRLEPYKGGEIAVRGFAKVADGIDATLEIVGDGSQRADLETWAAELGIADRVVFRGAVSQSEALRRIAGYDVVLVPSLSARNWKEQFGRVPVQAMAAGTAVIASDSGSLPEVLGGCGALVREGDIDDLADTLGRLLREPGTRQELAARGRQRAADVLSWEKLGDGCDRMYREMLER
jgi:glycosyltransferase involved in cell wall biosynthesis